MISMIIRVAIGVLALVLFPQFARSEEWPAKPIKIVVPYGAGNGIDILSRMIADRLSQKLGKTAFVENVPGVAAMLGAETVAKAEPDGYTFLSTANPPLTTNIYLFKSLPYDPYKAFDVVGMIADRGPFVISVNKDVPVNSLEELIDYAKTRPGQVRYAIDVSSAYQSAIGKWLNKQAGIELVEIRYRAPAQAFQDVIAGVAQISIASVAATAPFEGQLRRLAITSRGRFPGSEQLLPVETIFPGFHLEGFVFLAAPAGLPDQIRQRVRNELGVILQDPEVLKRIAFFGYATSGVGTPESIREQIRSDRDLWSRLSKELDIVPQ